VKRKRRGMGTRKRKIPGKSREGPDQRYLQKPSRWGMEKKAPEGREEVRREIRMEKRERNRK